MKDFFESIKALVLVLHPIAQIFVVIGVITLIVLVGINPVAGGLIIAFFAGLAQIFRR